MCVAILGKVVDILKKNQAIIDFSGVKRMVNIFFIDDLMLGDYVLVHGGCAIEKLDEKEALENIRLIKELLREEHRNG